MKLYKSAKGKQMLKISKSEWEKMGKENGWLIEAKGCPCCDDGPCHCKPECTKCDCNKD